MLGVWGAFNSVLSLNDVGRVQSLTCDTNNFNRCILDNGLFDVGFCGNPCTWQSRNLKRRLDRVVIDGSGLTCSMWLL